jgi:23S rRNA pseudouridine1911/1915/1917 synthase
VIEKSEFVCNERGVRLDAALLSAFPGTTRAFVRDAIANGQILVNGRSAPKGLKLKGGERIAVLRLLEAPDNRVKPVPDPNLAPIFEDDSLLAYDKPAGVPVQPISCTETGTLMNGVVAAHPECAAVGDSPLMAGALHRIDAGTSGLVMVARTEAAFEAMRAQFAAQTVEKTYLALVEGAVAVGGTLENDLAHDPTLPFCRMIDSRRNRLTQAQRERLRPLRAVTKYEPVAHCTAGCEERTLLEVKIRTGVTHQIRAQLALAGMHIVNDTLYGAFAVENMKGHRLHALAASFSHPSSGEPVELRTSMPGWARI